MSLNTTAIYLRWMKPLEYKDYYRYRVEGADEDRLVSEENTTVSGLVQGTNHTFCVTVIAATDAAGEKRCTSQYTGKALRYSWVI